MALVVGDNFGEALVGLLDIHKKEVGTLQEQVSQLRAYLEKLETSALLGVGPMSSGPLLAGHAMPGEAAAHDEQRNGTEAITVSLDRLAGEDSSCGGCSMGQRLQQMGPAIVVRDYDMPSDGGAPQPHRSRLAVPSAKQTGSHVPSASSKPCMQLSPRSASSWSTVCGAEPMQVPDSSSPSPMPSCCSKSAQARQSGALATCSCIACTCCTFEEAQAREQEHSRLSSHEHRETRRQTRKAGSLWEEPVLVSEAICVLDEAEECQTSPGAKRMFRRRAQTLASKRATLTQATINLLNSPPRRSFLKPQTCFDGICTVMILFNSVLAGIAVDHRSSASSKAFVTGAGYFCSAFFAMELVARMYAQGKAYFKPENRNWNLFDLMLVLASIVEIAIIDMYDSVNLEDTKSVSSILKIVKMFRIIRVFRVFRFFRELSLMALLIGDSMKSLMWALLLLLIIIYVFSIGFTIQAQDFLLVSAQTSPLPKEQEQQTGALQLDAIRRYFGSLECTAYILAQSILGGVSWGEVTDALLAMDWYVLPLFFFYIMFCLLAVLNIITGVFVDNAFETARMQREFLVQKEVELREKYVRAMRTLFMQMDVDDSGTVTLDEIEQYFQEDPRVYSYMCALGLDSEDLGRLFSLLDDTDSGELSVDAFLNGCLRLKGQARSIDVHFLIMQAKKTEEQMEARFKHLEQVLRKCSCASPQSLTSSGFGMTQPQAQKIHVAGPQEPEPVYGESDIESF